MSKIKINKQRALDLVMQLMAVPGKSREERAISEAVLAILQQYGVSTAQVQFDTAHLRTPLPGEVGNLIVKLPGALRRPRILLSAHLDTVPICIGCEPKKIGNSIKSANKETGLGADDRAGVAAVLIAAIETLEAGQPYPPLTLCFFVQEEIGLQGSRNLVAAKLGKPVMAFNFDGGDPHKMTIGATSGERLMIRLRGLSSHAGIAPEAGASAIHAAGLAIGKLQSQGWLGRVQKKRSVGTSNIGVIHGGSATNVVADFVEIQAEARSHDSSFRCTIADAIEHSFTEAAAQILSSGGTRVAAEVQRRVDYESFRLDADALPVKIAEAAIVESGGTPSHAVTDGGVDANWLVKHGIPTVTLGCGQRNVHTKSESLDVADYLRACHIARSLIVHASR